MQGKYPVITLCGSTRFKDQFMEVQKRLTLEGEYRRRPMGCIESWHFKNVGNPL